jgi:hypothetical protein
MIRKLLFSLGDLKWVVGAVMAIVLVHAAFFGLVVGCVCWAWNTLVVAFNQHGYGLPKVSFAQGLAAAILLSTVYSIASAFVKRKD